MQTTVSPLNPGLKDQVERLHADWMSAVPFPHVVIDDFLTDDFCRKMIEVFPPFEQGVSLNEQGLPGGKATVEDMAQLGTPFQELDRFIQTPPFLEMMSAVTGIPGLMYDPDYIGGGTHENRTLQELDPHVDFNFHPKRGWHRRCNLIVYLNPEWEESWGGALELHSDPWNQAENRVKTVLPIRNRAVLFETSECSWHAFRRITPPAGIQRISRRSFAIYLYTLDRPAEKTAPPHATVYVERPLPSSIASGKPIHPQDSLALQSLVGRRIQHARRIFEREQSFVGEILAHLQRVEGSPGAVADEAFVDKAHWLIARQDELLRFLYDRETSFTRTISELAAKPPLASPPTEFPIVGPVQLAHAIRGIYHDGWCAPLLESGFEILEETKRLSLGGFVPESVPRQTLELQVGENRYRMDLSPGRFVWTVPFEFVAGDQVIMALCAESSFVPARDGSSTDERELCYRLESVFVE